MTNQDKTFAYLHSISQLLVAIGFLLGMFSGLFVSVSMYWVFPLVCVNMIISIVAGDKTLPYTLTQGMLALLSTIPVLGTITSLAGIVVSVLALVECAAVLYPQLRTVPTTQPSANISPEKVETVEQPAEPKKQSQSTKTKSKTPRKPRVKKTSTAKKTGTSPKKKVKKS